MSRSDPYKRPRRAVKATALLVVEGETEEAFCKYLKRCYNRDCGLHVTIHNACGGGPDHILEVARKRCTVASYDHVFILIDEDQPITLKKTNQTLRSLRATLWLLGPCCVEGFFLSILGEKAPANTNQCKSRFHEVGLSEDHKLDHERYAGLFSKITLDTIRAEHPLLDKLIKLFSNTF